METIILITLAFIVGWKLSEIVMAASFKKILEELKVPDSALKDLARRNGIEIPADTTAEKQKGPEINIRIEQIDGRLFAYEVDQDSFVAQADDADQLLSRIIERFPVGTKITVLKEHGGDLITQAAERMKNAS
jgi:hypothetical protein